MSKQFYFPRFLYFTLDPYLIILSVKQGGIKYHILSFGMTLLGFETRSSGPLAKSTLILTAWKNLKRVIDKIS